MSEARRHRSKWTIAGRGEHARWSQCLHPLVVGLAAAACSRAAPPSLFPSAEAAIARMREASYCSRGLAGEARVDYLGPTGRLRAKALYVLARPDSLRFDLLSPFGGVISTLTSNHEVFALLDLKQKQWVTGRAGECSIRELLGVPVPPAALGELLTGMAPILRHEPGQSELAWRRGSYELVVVSPDGASQSVRLAPRPEDWMLPWTEQVLRVTDVEVRKGGHALYRASLAEHASAFTAPARVDPDGVIEPLPPSGPTCQSEVPRRLSFEVPETGQDLEIEQLEVVHNPPLVAELFDQRAPVGMRSVPSLCAP